MTSSIQNSKYAGVLKLMDCYAVVHFKEGQIRYPHKRIKTNIRVAQAVARAFAAKNYIPYKKALLELTHRQS